MLQCVVCKCKLKGFPGVTRSVGSYIVRSCGEPLSSDVGISPVMSFIYLHSESFSSQWTIPDGFNICLKRISCYVCVGGYVGG